MTRIRDDKDWQTATNLEELKQLYKTSKEKTDVSLLNKLAATAAESDEPPKKKIEESPKQSKVNKIDSYLKKDKSPKLVKVKKELNTSNTSETKSEESCNTSIDDIEMESNIKYQLLPENPLPDIFIDKRLGFYPDFLSFPEYERRHFERHWIAYGGIVVKSIKSVDIDYLVHNDDVIRLQNMQKLKRKMPDNVRHVNKNWLIKCINEVKLCDPARYPVYVEP